MRWLIETEDEKALEAMQKFANDVNEIYKKAFSQISFKLGKKLFNKIITGLNFEAVKVDNGVILRIPVSVPEFKGLTKLIMKITGFKSVLGSGWQKKTTKQIIGYLKSMDVDFRDVRYIGD